MKILFNSSLCIFALIMGSIINKAEAKETHEWTSNYGRSIHAEFVTLKGKHTFHTKEYVTILNHRGFFTIDLSVLNPESQALAHKLAWREVVSVCDNLLKKFLAK